MRIDRSVKLSLSKAVRVCGLGNDVHCRRERGGRVGTSNGNLGGRRQRVRVSADGRKSFRQSRLLVSAHDGYKRHQQSGGSAVNRICIHVSSHVKEDKIKVRQAQEVARRGVSDLEQECCTAKQHGSHSDGTSNTKAPHTGSQHSAVINGRRERAHTCHC